MQQMVYAIGRIDATIWIGKEPPAAANIMFVFCRAREEGERMTASVTRVSDPLPQDEIQGNILAPFTQEFQEFVLLSFRSPDLIAAATDEVGRATKGTKKANAAANELAWLLDAGRRARAWVGTIVRDVASTAAVLTPDGNTVRAAAAPTTTERLNDVGEAVPAGFAPRTQMVVSFASAALVTMHPELAADLVTDDALWAGAISDREYLGQRRHSAAIVGEQAKSAPRNWAVCRPGDPPIDALVTIAADTAEELEARSDEVRRQAVEDFGFAVLPVRLADDTLAPGQRCRRSDGREPFGFKDGISQPGIRGFTVEKYRDGRWESQSRPGKPIIAAGEFLFGYDREPGSYSGGRRSDSPLWMKNGSCQVWLRLEQDVDGWQNQMEALQGSSKGRVDVAAKVIGRNKDGSPLALSPAGEPLPPGADDFTYDNDPDGVETPVFAHIRKMNPRNQSQYRSRTRPLLRRGIPYEEPVPSAARQGLVFNAFMRSIPDQFEYLMRQWASNPVSLLPTGNDPDGPDPLVGASDAPCRLRQKGRPDATEIYLRRYVRTTGAMYLFAPSISTLRELGQSDPLGGTGVGDQFGVVWLTISG